MITVKYNIDFKKALKQLEKEKLSDTLNEGVADKFAKNSAKFIKAGKVEPELSDKNPRGVDAPPLFDTGKLARSLKGTTEGITGEDYAKEHRKVGGYRWTKDDGKTVDVPQREFIPHFINGRTAISGTKKEILAIYKEFKENFVRVLNKRIRKKKGILL